MAIPEGTPEGARLWRNYLHACTDAGMFDDTPQTVVQVDPGTGEAALETENGQSVQLAETGEKQR